MKVCSKRKDLVLNDELRKEKVWKGKQEKLSFMLGREKYRIM